MLNKITLNNITLHYDLQYKKVKNINLRIKSDRTIHVSANRYVSQKSIDAFLISKADFIIKALENYKIKADKPQHQYFSEDEICDVITNLCKKAYPYFEKRGIKYPQIKFRKMVSLWGSCHAQKNILTFNTALMYAPLPCIEYVVFHEFTHFLQANHSSRFYNELEKVCPDWKTRRLKLKEISARQSESERSVD